MRINYLASAQPGIIAMNIRSFFLKFLVSASLFFCLFANAQPDEGTLVVVNRDGGSVSFIDMQTGLEMARHPIGARVPHELAISPNGRTVISSEYGTGTNPGTKLQIFDVPSASLLGEIDLGPETRPHSFVFLPDGRRAVVTMELAGAIALVDILDRRVIDSFPVGGSGNHMVRLSSDGNTAYVAGRGGVGTLSIVDLTGDNELVVIETGAGAEGLALSPDGSEVWVGNRGAYNLSVIDTRSQRVIDTIDLEGAPVRVEISAAGRVVVPTGGTLGQATAPGLSILDLETHERIDRYQEPEVADGPGGFPIHLVGETLIAGDRTAGLVLAFDLDDFPSSKVVARGLNNPDGIVYSPLRMSVFSQ